MGLDEIEGFLAMDLGEEGADAVAGCEEVGF